MPDDLHDPAEELLPWYATGQLDPADRATVDAHLAACARCRRALANEHKLIAQFQTLDPQVDSGWAQLRSRIEAPQPAGSRIGEAFSDFWHALTRPVIAAFAAVQLVFVALAAMIMQWASQPTFIALGSAPVVASANAIVMFKPDTREAQLRTVLAASNATLVGGPTDANAYVLHVPASARSAALAKLQRDPNVTLAQPIDSPAP